MLDYQRLETCRPSRPMSVPYRLPSGPPRPLAPLCLQWAGACTAPRHAACAMQHAEPVAMFKAEAHNPAPAPVSLPICPMPSTPHAALPHMLRPHGGQCCRGGGGAPALLPAGEAGAPSDALRSGVPCFLSGHMARYPRMVCMRSCRRPPSHSNRHPSPAPSLPLPCPPAVRPVPPPRLV